MIVTPPQDPNESRSDPVAEALGPLYEQFTNVQNLAEFHGALRNRDALYDIQRQEIGDNYQEFENLHPKDFYSQFHRRADEDDKSVISDVPYPVRQQLRAALFDERQSAYYRAMETYKQLFIDHQLGQLEQDRQYYLGKMADAVNDNDRERYLTALVSRIKLSGDVGLVYKQDADRTIENIPSDFDMFNFNREFAADPARAQRLLGYGAYPNLKPEQRAELVNGAEEALGKVQPADAPGGAPAEIQADDGDISVPQESRGPGAVGEPRQEAATQAPGAVNSNANAALKREFATEGIEETLRQREAEGNSGSNNGVSRASNREDGANLLQVAAAGQGGTNATQGQKPPPPQKAATAGASGQTISQRGNYDPINKEEFASIVEDYTPIAQAHGNGSLDDPKNPFKFTRPVTDYAGRTITPEAMNIAVANTYAEMTEPERTKTRSEIQRQARVKGSEVPIITKITEEGVASDVLGITGSYFRRLDEIQRDDIPDYVRRKYGTVDGRIPSDISEIILAKVGSGIQYAPPYDGSYKYAQATAGSDKINMGIYKLAVAALLATAKEGPWYDFDSFRAIKQGQINRTFTPGEINLGSGHDFMQIKPFETKGGR